MSMGPKADSADLQPVAARNRRSDRIIRIGYLEHTHKSYVANLHRDSVTPRLMTDLSDPTRPQILAVERGRDTTATLKCLDRLTQEQRQQVRTHRVDMGPAYPAACRLRLPHSRAVTDRFHVAKRSAEDLEALAVPARSHRNDLG